MAKNIKITDYEGTIRGIVRYKRLGKEVEQRKGGFDGERTRNEERYEATRQRRSEFGNCSRIAGLIKRRLNPWLDWIPGNYVMNYIQSAMLAVKDCDTDSPKGEKTVRKGLERARGLALLEHFSFNQKCTLSTVVYAKFSVDAAAGRLVIPLLDPGSELRFPIGKTVVGLQFVVLRMDFDATECSVGESDVVFVSAEAEPIENLVFEAAVPEGNGVLIGLLFAACGEVFRDEFEWVRNEGNVLEVVQLSIDS